MSYDRLVMCVDNSGSMGGPKIRNSIKYLNEIAQEFNITTNYFRFGCKVEAISSYSQSTLPCNDGTYIETCLNDLFNNHLRKFSGSKTKFIFVTDAEDSISNVSNVISNKRSCEAAFNNGLHSYCLLTGHGSCSSELQQIFGSNSFDHCTDSKFKTILQKITGGVKTVNKASTNRQNLVQQVNELKNDSNTEMKEIGEKCEQILEKAKEAKRKNQQAQSKIDTVKNNMQNLNQQTATVTSTANAAHTDTEVDAVEREINQLKADNRKESKRLSDAGKLLDESSKILNGETTRAEDISRKLQANGQKISQKAETIISNIITSLKELSEITHGSYEQVQELKSQFRSDLDGLMQIVQENESLQTELVKVQQSIDGTFKSLKRGRVEYSEFKQKIQDNMSELNQLLDILDSR